MSPMRREMTQHIILRVIAKLLIPYILLFALYVQGHGDYSPGGGFQAGVIFASGLILYTLVFGFEPARKVLNLRVLEIMIAAGVLIYGGIGLLCLLLGGEFLDYSVLAHHPEHGQHRGIFYVELGVGLTVTAAMTTIFFSFIHRTKSE